MGFVVPELGSAGELGQECQSFAKFSWAGQAMLSFQVPSRTLPLQWLQIRLNAHMPCSIVVVIQQYK